MAAEQKSLQIPASIISPVELSRIAREAELLDASLQQAAIRTGGQETSLPKLSRLMNDIVEANGLNVLHQEDRNNLTKILEFLRVKSPVLHISFSVDPSPAFLRKLIIWMRDNMHPYMMIRVGLQPSIGAGCVVRTDNKYFDLSLRERFTQEQHLLFDKLHGVENPQPIGAKAANEQSA